MTSYHETVYPGVHTPDPGTLIRFSDEAGARAKRAELTEWVFGLPSLPARMPDNSVPTPPSDISQLAANGWTNLAGGGIFLDATARPFPTDDPAYEGFVSNSFLARAKDPRLNRLVAIVWGHGETFEGVSVPGQDFAQDGIPLARHFVARGFDALMMEMPVSGKNPPATVFAPKVNGMVAFSDHRLLGLLETEDYTPMREFAEPAAVALNGALASAASLGAPYEEVGFVGFGGGGWQATLVAALDERIKKTYCCSGSLPLHMFHAPPNDANPKTRGLGEHFEYRPNDGSGLGSALYDKTNMLELYSLAAAGGRRYVQTFNRYDPVAFAGVNYRAYEQPLKDAIAKMGGGSYGCYSDENAKHTLSDGALAFITEDLLAG